MKLSVTQQRNVWWSLSIALAAIGAISMALSFGQFGAPIPLGLDFAGGTRLQLERDCSVPNNCDAPMDVSVARDVMMSQGLGNNVQVIGEDQQGLLVRTGDLGVEKRSRLQDALEAELGKFDPEQLQIDTVGPTIGRRLLRAGLASLLAASVGIVLYLSLRFQLDYAVFAIVALFHDVWITAGIFSLLGRVSNFEADSLFVVALLTIIGFSVNDTVVIYDRVREILKLHPEWKINEVVDEAVNQTLTRSINTTATTLLPLVAIFAFGGETLKYFALALIVGFTLGAYSSIFIASAGLALWRSSRPQVVETVPASDPTTSETAASEEKP